MPCKVQTLRPALQQKSMIEGKALVQEEIIQAAAEDERMNDGPRPL